jgi:hypothetical protein
MGQKPSSKRGTNLRIFVKKGATRRFERLKRDSASLPVQVEWDRRVGERRSPVQVEGAEAVGLPPRRGDRRKAPPFTWELADFVVVEENDEKEP